MDQKKRTVLQDFITLISFIWQFDKQDETML